MINRLTKTSCPYTTAISDLNAPFLNVCEDYFLCCVLDLIMSSMLALMSSVLVVPKATASGLVLP